VDPVSLPIRTGLARTLYFTRDHAAARDEYRAALRLDSAFPAAHVGLGLVHERLGDLDAAVRAYETADRLAGGAHPLPPALLGHAHGAAGRTALSDAMLARLRVMERARYVPPEYRALVHLGAGRRDEALRELEAAHAARSAAVLYLPVEPMVDPLRTEPRFRALLPR
jgi:tetratricopeptide (TPR) repeat protein